MRLLEGNRSHRPLPLEEPPAAGPCDPPANLSAPARHVWLALAPELVAKGLLAPRWSRWLTALHPPLCIILS
ncbi:MAG TPA: hypothetical protein VEJ84_01840 [Acidimicrobiales bacterium]|nr:hypothetical protein [Acidimicrobiales bacterium]